MQEVPGPMSADPKLTAHMEAEFEKFCTGARRQIVLEERTYAMATGARLAVMAMMDAEVVKDDMEYIFRSWAQAGGVSGLEVAGVKIVPPEYP